MAFGRYFAIACPLALGFCLAAPMALAQGNESFLGEYRHERQGDLPQVEVTLFDCDGYLCADGTTDSSQWKAACTTAAARAHCNIAGRRSSDGMHYEGTSDFEQQGNGLLFLFEVVYEDGRRFRQSVPLARIAAGAPAAQPSTDVGAQIAEEAASETPPPTARPAAEAEETVIIESGARPTPGAVSPSGLGRAAAPSDLTAELGLVQVERPADIPPGVRVYRHPSGRGIAFSGTIGARRDDWRWVTARDGEVPPGAFVAVNDPAGPAYICRAPNRGGVHPGYLPPGGTACHIASAGRHYRMKTYAVLTGGAGDFVWQRSQNAAAPANGVVGGESGGIAYQICRATIAGVVLMGKLEGGFCRIGQEGREEAASSYEVLVGQ